MTLWILNSISRDICEDFLYFEIVRELWKELEQRFGESNGPLLYQIKRNISLLSQGDLTLMQCYAKMKRYWSQLSVLRHDPVCHCDCICNANKKIVEYREDDKLLQLLIGLKEEYENVVN